MPQGRGLETDLQRFAALTFRAGASLPLLLFGGSYNLSAQRLEIGVKGGVRLTSTSHFNNSFPGFSSIVREGANSWEFPLMLKYRVGTGPVHPGVGIGYAPRTVSRTYRTFPVTHGLVVPGGLTWDAGSLRLSPELRYVHWNGSFLNDSGPSFQLTSKPDELFVLLGISWH